MLDTVVREVGEWQGDADDADPLAVCDVGGVHLEQVVADVVRCCGCAECLGHGGSIGCGAERSLGPIGCGLSLVPVSPKRSSKWEVVGTSICARTGCPNEFDVERRPGPKRIYCSQNCKREADRAKRKTRDLNELEEKLNQDARARAEQLSGFFHDAIPVRKADALNLLRRIEKADQKWKRLDQTNPKSSEAKAFRSFAFEVFEVIDDLRTLFVKETEKPRNRLQGGPKEVYWPSNPGDPKPPDWPETWPP